MLATKNAILPHHPHFGEFLTEEALFVLEDEQTRKGELRGMHGLILTSCDETTF